MASVHYIFAIVILSSLEVFVTCKPAPEPKPEAKAEPDCWPQSCDQGGVHTSFPQQYGNLQYVGMNPMVLPQQLPQQPFMQPVPVSQPIQYSQVLPQPVMQPMVPQIALPQPVQYSQLQPLPLPVNQRSGQPGQIPQVQIEAIQVPQSLPQQILPQPVALPQQPLFFPQSLPLPQSMGLPLPMRSTVFQPQPPYMIQQYPIQYPQPSCG